MIAAALHSRISIGWVIVLILVVIFTARRSKTAINVLSVLIAMGLAAAALLLLMPASRPMPGVRSTPAVPGTPEPLSLPASGNTDQLTLDRYTESIKNQGDRAVDIARIKIETGTEVIADAAERIAAQSRELARQYRVPPVPEVARRVTGSVRHARPTGLAATGLMAFAIGAFLYLGYIFLDASTRGHFTWSLRIVSVVTFVALCMALSVLRQGL